MRISDVSRETGLSIDTLRFYEKEALVHPRRINGQRDYRDTDLERLQMIRQLRELDVPIPDIRHLLRLDDSVATINRLDVRSLDVIADMDAFLAALSSRLERRIADLQSQADRFAHMRAKIALLVERGGLDDVDESDLSDRGVRL